nr:molybdopterin-dependent oxidoreductase [Gemmatimonadota bacterium]
IEFRLQGCHLSFDAEEDRLLRKLDKNPNTRGAIEILLDGTPDRAAALGDRGARERDAASAFFGRIRDEARGAAAGGALLVFRWDQEALGEVGLAALDALDAAGSVIFCGPWEPEYSERCEVLLPAARTGEREGTFTNYAGRVQAIREVLQPFGIAREGWAILDAIGRDLGLEICGPSAAETFDRLAERVGSFRGLRFAELGSTGAWLGGIDANGKGPGYEPAAGGPADSGPVAPGAVTKEAPGGPSSPVTSTTGGRGAR